MELDDDISLAAKYAPAMAVKNKTEALAYLRACIRQTMRQGVPEEEARAIELSNIGYFAGNYGQEVRLRVEELFDTVHPYFGAAKDGPVSPEMAFKIGMKLGRASHERRHSAT